jgi:hypothetical protein
MRVHGRLRRLEEAAAAARPCPVCDPRGPLEVIETYYDPDAPRSPSPPPEPAPDRCPGCGRPWSGWPLTVIEIMRPLPREERTA